MRHLILIFFLILFNPQLVFGQFSPSIHNYSIAEYKAGNQNWDIARADNGKVYVANNSGLLEYDGLVWQFYQLPNKTVVRSVLTVDDIVYTGSYEEFGYWEKDEYGALVYNSLSDEVSGEISPNEEIWQIVKFRDKIIFRSFSNVYVYDSNSVTRLRPNSTVISCSVVDGELYISTLKQGVYLLKENELQQFYNNDLLLDAKIISIDKYKDKLLLTTSLRGCFFLENGRLSKTSYEVNEQIKLHQLNNFSILDSGEMIFGTIKDGVFVTDINGNIKFHINKENGLLNNTVLGQSLDEDNNLWFGLDNGVANIELNNSNYFYNDVSGRLGAVYDIIEFKDVIYIGTNTGLFKLDENDQLDFVEGSQGQVWDLKIIEGELFCGHNEGTFLVDGDDFKMISSHTGGWTIKKVPETESTYIQGTYSGLVRFRKHSGSWEVKHLGKTTIPSRFLVFENSKTAWVAHATKGVFRVNFDENHDTITSISDYQNKGITSDYNVRLYNIMNNICFKANEGWQKYEAILDSIIPFKLLNEKLGKDNYVISEEDVQPFALKNSSGFISFKSFTDDNDGLVLNDKFLKDRYIIGYENISKLEDSSYALNLDNGFMIINSTSKNNIELFKPDVEKILVNGNLISAEKSSVEAIAFNYNKSIVVELSSAKSINHFFEYKIPSLNEGWTKVEGNRATFNNLKDGVYDISFRTRDTSGNISEAHSIKIDVLPPWYRDKLGLLLYFVILALILASFYIMHNRKVAKEQRVIKIKYQKEQQKLLREKTLENEKRIVQLKNESLHNEIKLKSKQLANNAMALVKKNETLQEIKKELMLNKDGFSNYYAFKKLVKKLDNSIVLKDEWEVFEENFTQVHDEFFEILKSRHSKLTPKDLKICAYIKMNLSSKEIAPLMNISVRGVETHRYRLKKKLDLENDISVVDYLLNIKK